MSQIPRVVIIGAGFGALRAAKALKKAPVEVLMLDRYNYHTFQPLLYQVAAAELDPEQIAHSVRGIYHKQKNFYFCLANVVGVQWDRQEVLMKMGSRFTSIPYFGSRGEHQLFRHPRRAGKCLPAQAHHASAQPAQPHHAPV